MASLAVLTVALSLLAAPLQTQLAFGSEPSATTDSSRADSDAGDREAAKQAFDRGLAAVSRSEFEAAVVEFEAAYRTRPHPVTLFNLALALEKAGRLPEAWELFEAVEDRVESETERREVRRHLRAIASQIAIVEIDAKPKRRLCIDGLALPKGETSDYRLAVEPGRHQLLLDDHQLELEFTAGDRRVLLLDDLDQLGEQRRRSPLVPAMSGVTIGSGALALGLGVGAAVTQHEPTRTGLAAGAAASAGVAVAAGIVALIVETRDRNRAPAKQSKRDRKKREQERACPGSQKLERRLDLQLAPLLEQAATVAKASELPTPSMPVPTREAEFPHPRSIAPPRANAQKRPTNSTPM